jgi:superfamily II DNA or RNA helicase
MATAHQRPPREDGAPPFETETAVLAWLREHRIAHASRWSLGALAPHVDAAVLSLLRAANGRRRLIDLVSEEALARWVWSPASAETVVPAIAWRVLDDERIAAAEARATIEDRLVPPDDPRTHEVHGLTIGLRARIPAAVAPRPVRALQPSALQLDLARPGFRLQETRCSELPEDPRAGFLFPDTRVSYSPDAATAECTCGAKACVHVLATIDTILLWLAQPWTPAFGEVLDELVRPGWERTLRALDRAVEESTGGVADVEISWRLKVNEGYGVEVAPWVHRRTKKGRSTGTKLTRRKLLQEHGAQLSAADARLAALLPDGDAPASRALLFELVDHPDIRLEGTLDARVHIERAKVGLVAEDRGGVVMITAGIDGAPLPPPMVERLRKARPEEGLFHWERGTRRLTVLDVGAETRALLTALAKHDNAFPPESHAALIEKLSTLSLKVPVALPRSVMGEAVPLDDLPVIRLEAEPGGEIRVELRTRPLADSASFLPGEGAKDIHVRRGTKPVHAVRDLARERTRAEALQAALPLHDAAPDRLPFRFTIDDPQAALALVAACAALEPAPTLEWIGQPLRLLGSRGAGSLRVVLERKKAWFGVLGELAVEGERVELARLLDAARRKQRFLQVSADTYVEIEEALRAHLGHLADHVHASRHGLEIGASAAEAIAMLELAGASVDADQTWRELAARIAAARALDPPVPAGLDAELRDYQREGYQWMTRLASWGAGAVLADDMGLGKTVQALAVLLDRAAAGPALVLAPTSVAWNWIDEARRFAPSLRMTLFADADIAARGPALERLGPGDVLVLSYGLLAREIDRLAAVRFATIVFDEAQTLKNARTHRVRAARALHGDFKVALSGTPLENHLGELWSLFAVVFPGLLGSWESFRTRFAAPIEKRSDPGAAPALARVLQPFLLRRTKAQVETQLPPRTDVRVPVVLSTEEWTMYEDARLATLSDLESRKAVMKDQERRVDVLAALTRLRLLASHPRLYDASSTLASSKLDRFLELVTELRAEGQRALVFSQFTRHLALVREVLDAHGITYEYLDGQTPQAARAARVRAFQDGTADLFLISLKAGGFGLNLTAATSVIHLDPWWNPAVEDQASDRAHRIGQTRPVTVYRLVARGTIEEQMLALHEHKRALVAGVLEGKDQAAQLSTDELIAMLSRRPALAAPVAEG